MLFRLLRDARIPQHTHNTAAKKRLVRARKNKIDSFPVTKNATGSPTIISKSSFPPPTSPSLRRPWRAQACSCGSIIDVCDRCSTYTHTHTCTLSYVYMHVPSCRRIKNQEFLLKTHHFSSFITTSCQLQEKAKRAVAAARLLLVPPPALQRLAKSLH